MGRFVTNSQGREVYIPSVEEASLAGNLLNPRPLDDVAGLVSPISGAGAQEVDDEGRVYVAPDIEVQQPVIYDEEKMQYENLLLDKEQNRRMRQIERDEFRQNVHLGDDRPFMGVPPRESFLGRVSQQDEQQQREAEQNRIASERDENQRRRLAKPQQIRSRKEALLNSPEALENIKAVHQGTMSEEDFKTWWVSQQDPQNAHAWEIGVEGDAYQKLWARLNQDDMLAKIAGEFLGKTVEDPDRTAVGSVARDSYYAQLKEEYDQRKLKKELRRESRPLFHDPLGLFDDTSIKKMSEDIYTPKPFDPYSPKARAEIKDRLGQEIITNRVEGQVSNLEQLTKDLADAETASSQAVTGFGPGTMFGTPELAAEEDLIIKNNQAQRKWRKLQNQIQKHLNDPYISDSTKNHFRFLLQQSGRRLVEVDANSRYEIRLKEKANTLASTNYWNNLEKRKGRKLSQEERIQYLRDTDTPIDLFLEEQTHKQLSKHRKAAALKSIQNSPAFKVLVGPLSSSDTGFQTLLGITDGITGLLRVPVSIGAAASVPGFTKFGSGVSDFLEDNANAVDIYTTKTLGDGRSLKTLGLNPHQFRGVVSSIYQSLVLGGFGLGTGGIATGFGATTFADEYQHGIDEGLSRGTASLYAGIQGVFEGSFEAILPGTNKWAASLATKGILKQSGKEGLKIVAPTIKRRFFDFAKTIGQEQASEALTTITQLYTEGSFIHEDENFFSENIGPALLETVETVFAQTVLMAGGGNLVSGRNRRLKARISEPNRRHQERLDQMYAKLAPLTGQIRTSGSLSDRLAEVINRVSPAGAAQLRKLREQGKKISRSTIEKLYGPEIAGRLTKLEQREAFADAILGQKQRVQQEVIDNSPVLQESPTKVVEVEDQQTGEKNVVTVNVEQGQTAQEAVDEQVRTATGESPVVTAEPATESPSQRSEWDHYVNTGDVRPETVDRLVDKIASGQKLTQKEIAMREGAASEIESRLQELAPAEAPSEAPADDDVSRDRLFQEVKDAEAAYAAAQGRGGDALKAAKQRLDNANKALQDSYKKPEAPTEAPAEGPFYAASKQALDEQEIDPITGRVVDPLKEWVEETHGPATDAFGESLNPGDVIEDKFGTKYRVKANGMLAQLKDDGSESGNYFRLRKRKSRDTAAEYEADTDARTLLATSRLVEKTEGAAWPAKMKRKKKKAPAQAPTEAAEGVEAYLEDDMPESYRKRFIEGAKPFIEGVTSRPPNTKQEFLREAHSRMEGGADSGLLKRYMMDILAGKPAPKNSNIKVYEDRLQARLLLEQLENNAVETDTVLYRGDRPVTAGIDYTKVEPGDVIEVKGRPLISGITTDKKTAYKFMKGTQTSLDKKRPGIIWKILPGAKVLPLQSKSLGLEENEHLALGKFKVVSKKRNKTHWLIEVEHVPTEAPTEAATEQEVASVPADPSTFEVGPGARKDASRPVFKPRTMTPEQQRELYEFSKQPGVKLKDIVEKYDEIMGTTPEEKTARRQHAFAMYGDSEAGNWAGGVDKGTTVGTITKDGALNERHGSGRTNVAFSSSDPDVKVADRVGKNKKQKEEILETLYPGAKFKGGIATGFSQQGTVGLPTARPAPAKTQASGKTKPHPAKKQ